MKVKKEGSGSLIINKNKDENKIMGTVSTKKRTKLIGGRGPRWSINIIRRKHAAVKK